MFQCYELVKKRTNIISTYGMRAHGERRVETDCFSQRLPTRCYCNEREQWTSSISKLCLLLFFCITYYVNALQNFA